MNKVALFPLQNGDFQQKILSISSLDNKYYTAPVTVTTVDCLSLDFQVVILDDLKLISNYECTFEGTIIFIGSTDDSSCITIDPLDSDALQCLKDQLYLIDWPVKHLKSKDSSKIDIFEQLLKFKRGDNIDLFLNLLKQLE